MANRKVLIVEDDEKIIELVSIHLRDLNLEIEKAMDGPSGLDKIQNGSYDLIILDIMLPGRDGIQLCRDIRQKDKRVPVLMLTARSEELDKVLGLEIGADDYLTKPFHKEELVARIHAIVRRSKGHSQSIIKTGKLSVNLDTKTVEVSNQRVHLTGKEYAMLELLSLRKGSTLTKEMFLNHLYGGIDEPELKIIDVFICKLRKKLATASEGDNYIETVWGRGYVLRNPSEETDEAVA